jgi:hypothetical protein
MQLASLKDSTGRNLRWSKTPNRQEFQLRDKATPVAVLAWDGAGSRARGSTTEGHWTFNRGAAPNPINIKGALQPRIIFEPEGGGESCEISPGFTESVSFGGSEFRWQLEANTRVAKWLRDSGEVLVTMDYSPGASDAEVVIAPEASDVPDLSLLILSGWYALRNGRA